MESSQPTAPSWSVRFAPTDGDPMSGQTACMLSRMFENHVRAGGGTQEEQAARGRALLTQLAEKHGKAPEPTEPRQPATQSRTQQPTAHTKPQPATLSRTQRPTTQQRTQPPTQTRAQQPPAQLRKAPAMPERNIPPPYNPGPYPFDSDLLGCSEYSKEMSERKAEARRRAIVKAVVVSILPDIVGFDRSVKTNALGGCMPQPEDFLEEDYTEDEDEEDYTEDEDDYDEEEYDEEEYDEEEEEEEEEVTPPETPGVFERLRNELKNSEQYAAGKFNIQRWVDLTREAMQPPAAASAPVVQKRARVDDAQLAAPPAKRAAVEVRKPAPEPKTTPSKPSKAPADVTQKRARPAEDAGELVAPTATRAEPTPAPAAVPGRRQTRSATAAAATATADAATANPLQSTAGRR